VLAEFSFVNRTVKKQLPFMFLKARELADEIALASHMTQAVHFYTKPCMSTRLEQFPEKYPTLVVIYIFTIFLDTLFQCRLILVNEAL